MASKLKVRLILILSLISLCHLYNCASYKQLLKHGQLNVAGHKGGEKLVRVKLSKSEELDSFEALSRSHDAFKDGNIKDRKPIGLNSQLVGSVGLGTPVQEFKFIFDTTWSNTFIASVNCTNCDGKKRYNSSASTTYIKNGTDIEIGFDSGILSSDVMTLNDDIVLENLTFAEMLKVMATAEDAPYDGLFSLGFDYGSQKDIVSPMRKMLDQKLIKHEVFSFYQNSTGGEIVFGGYDENRFRGMINWLPNADLVNWAFRAHSITLKESAISEGVKVCEYGCQVNIYTYLTYIIGPPKYVMLINEAIGAEVDEDDDTMFVLPDCDLSKLPNLAFTINHDVHEFTPEQYIQKVKKGDKVICVSSLHAVALPYPDEWFVGSSIIGHIYTVFDQENRALGFAYAK